MNSCLHLLLCVSLLPIAAFGQTQFTPPPASASLLPNSIFTSATPIATQIRSRFTECDTKDTCQGKALKFGCSKDPNHNTTILRLHGGAVFFDGKMGVDADGSPLSKNHPGQTDQPETSFRFPSAGHPNVDADKVPFIVIPGGGFAKALEIQMGDIAAVVHDGHIAYGLVADQGPICKLGEGSIELHEKLGHKVCLARNAAHECTRLGNSGLERNVLYFVFPGSKSIIIKDLQPENVNQRIESEGAKLMDALKAGS